MNMDVEKILTEPYAPLQSCPVARMQVYGVRNTCQLFLRSVSMIAAALGADVVHRFSKVGVEICIIDSSLLGFGAAKYANMTIETLPQPPRWAANRLPKKVKLRRGKPLPYANSGRIQKAKRRGK